MSTNEHPLAKYPLLKEAVERLLDQLDVHDALAEARLANPAEAVISQAFAAVKPSAKHSLASDLGVRNSDDAKKIWRGEPTKGDC